MAAENPRSPESLAQVTADLFMGAEDQMQLHKDVLVAAYDLRRTQTPSSFKVELSDIPLHGEVPLSFLPMLGDTYTRLNYSAEKTAKKITDSENSEHDAQASLWLLGTGRRGQQMQFVTESSDVEFGYNKQFFLYPYGVKDPQARLSCGDLSMVLDDIIPDTGRFSALSDPRSDKRFDEIALAMGDLLRPLATNIKSTRTFIARDITASMVDNDAYISEIGDRLVLEEVKDVSKEATKLTLSSSAVVQLASASVIEHFKYSFVPDSNKAMRALARLTLISADLDKETLHKYLKSTQKQINPIQIGQRAIEALTSEG